MKLIIFYVEFDIRRNLTYKSTLEASKRLNLIRPSSLLSSTKWANYRAWHGRQSGAACRPRQTNKYNNTFYYILWSSYLWQTFISIKRKFFCYLKITQPCRRQREENHELICPFTALKILPKSEEKNDSRNPLVPPVLLKCMLLSLQQQDC